MIDLEEMADAILREKRRKNPVVSQKGDILLEDQWIIRHKRERLTPTGHFDIGCKRGVYGRVWAAWRYPLLRRWAGGRQRSDDDGADGPR